MPEHRIWRLRKLHQFVDAELHPLSDVIVELRFFYNGGLTFVRECPSRACALEAAGAKRAELERDGWMFHW